MMSYVSIKEASERLGIAAETIRLYERKGLIITERTDGGQRRFDESDIERLRCIRKAINAHKISIEGIRRIQGLVPCWKYKRCPPDRRETCPSYRRAEAGCWTAQHTNDPCAKEQCRSCTVYRRSGNCETIRLLIHSNQTPSAHPHKNEGNDL